MMKDKMELTKVAGYK